MQRNILRARHVYVVGCGVAGLSAAVALAQNGTKVTMFESAPVAGGRCRSYMDPVLGRVIDNGNHLLLSGNSAALRFLAVTGGLAGVTICNSAEYAFVDLNSLERWKIRLNTGIVPWWIFDESRRVPGTHALEYLRLGSLFSARGGATIGDVCKMIGDVEQRLIHPFLLAALNIDPQFGDAGLAAGVFRASLLRGGGACRPIIMLEGLSGAFVEPAIRFLTHHGAEFQTGRRLRSIETDTDRVSALRFNGAEFVLGPDEAVVLAVPPREAARIVPGLIVPSEYRSILNAHFVCEPSAHLPPITGVIGATTQWLFAYPGRLSVTVSDAGSLIGSDKAMLAARIWREVATITGLAPLLPKWRILHEREATFAATPAQNLRRPPSVTRWRNLALAGDWTATGLPATIEGAVRSGETAARALLKASGTKWLHGRFGKAVSKFRG